MCDQRQRDLAATEVVTYSVRAPAHHAQEYSKTPRHAEDFPQRFRVLREDQGMSRRVGAPRGQIQRGNGVGYELGSGRSYRTSVNLPPDEAEKIVIAAAAMNYSVSGLMQQLVARMEVDEHGAPTWYEPPDEQQQRLIA